MHPAENFFDLTELAKQSMIGRHLLPEFSSAALAEANEINEPAQPSSEKVKEMRHLLWFSLDNDDSLDLDQLTYAEEIEENRFKIYVAIADVDSLVKKGSAIDLYAECNTTSVYTPTKIFPMLPEKLSTNLTSLNENEDRVAVIMEIDVDETGFVQASTLYQGHVRNKAKLAYNSVSAWLDGEGPPPKPIEEIAGLEKQIRLQDKIAAILRLYRHRQGALTLQTVEPQTVFKDEMIVEIKPAKKNRGRNLIEDFMVSANQATAHFLNEHQQPSFRRVVRTPQRWDRIVEITQQYDVQLPPQPDAIALEKFLKKQLNDDPLHFPDLSLTIIKLLGNGEYVLEYPGEEPIGHFSLAVKNYTHSTAPNRRFPDLITQRLVKSILADEPVSYTDKELQKLARQCTEKEDEAEKVERKMKKSAACALLSSRINDEFDALVTGSAPKGTWVRVLDPPVEGKLIQGFQNVKVGDKIRVRLIHVDIENGFIDFINT